MDKLRFLECYFINHAPCKHMNKFSEVNNTLYFFQIQAIKKANEAKIRQLREESDNAMETQRGFLNEVKKQGTKNMESLRQQNMRNEAQRNQQIRELQQSQAGLNQKIQEATQKVQVLQNRPRKLLVIVPGVYWFVKSKERS